MRSPALDPRLGKRVRRDGRGADGRGLRRDGGRFGFASPRGSERSRSGAGPRRSVRAARRAGPARPGARPCLERPCSSPPCLWILWTTWLSAAPRPQFLDGGSGASLARRQRRASLERGILERGSRYVHKFSRGSASTMSMRALTDVMQPEPGARASATWGSRAERGAATSRYCEVGWRRRR
jgi:hypothetical protein